MRPRPLTQQTPAITCTHTLRRACRPFDPARTPPLRSPAPNVNLRPPLLLCRRRTASEQDAKKRSAQAARVKLAPSTGVLKLPPPPPDLPQAVVLPPIARGATAGPSAGPSSSAAAFAGYQPGFVSSSANTDGSARPNKAPTNAPGKTRVDFDGRVSPRQSEGRPSTPPSKGGNYSI